MTDVLQLADHWQTLIAGILGLAGGIAAYIGARYAAKRQVTAVERQIADSREARAQQEERSRNAILWAVRSEARRLENEARARRQALPGQPGWSNLKKDDVAFGAPLFYKGKGLRFLSSV